MTAPDDELLFVNVADLDALASRTAYVACTTESVLRDKHQLDAVPQPNGCRTVEAPSRGLICLVPQSPSREVVPHYSRERGPLLRS